MFTWSYGIILVVVGFSAICCITAMYRSELYYTHPHVKGGSTPNRRALVLFVSLLLGAGVVWNGFNATFSGMDFHPDDTRTVNDSTVAEQYFGFESGKEYPLVLGSQVSTATMSMHNYMRHGFFSTTMETSVSGEGGPAITISYTQDDSTYTLSLPRNRTIIHQDDTKEPSVAVELTDTNTARAYREKLSRDCQWKISNLAIAQQCRSIYSDEIKDHANVRKVGLGWLVDQAFSSAEITMTHSMYAQLIGGIK